MKYLSFVFLIVAVTWLSGCSLDESTAVTKKKDAAELALDKLPAEKKPTAPPESAPTPQSSPQPNPKAMSKQYPSAPAIQIDANKKYTATLHTDKGDIVVELDVKNMPKTVDNFVFLAKDHFYDNTIFHRTMKGFMIQGGDPEGTGVGGPGYNVNETPKVGTTYTRGTIAMAKTGADPAGTSGSQFFIMHSDNPLPPDYATFGHVTSGLDVVDMIATAPTQPGGEGSTPVTPVVVKSVDILEK
ncbi:MAG: peptidylprolyl isomerase [Candidatus Moraniibacteriota bacterium]